MAPAYRTARYRRFFSGSSPQNRWVAVWDCHWSQMSCKSTKASCASEAAPNRADTAPCLTCFFLRCSFACVRLTGHQLMNRNVAGRTEGNTVRLDLPNETFLRETIGTTICKLA